MLLCGACQNQIDTQEGNSFPTHFCKNPLHADSGRVYLHTPIQCVGVWQPVADGEDSFCSKACLVAFNQKRQDEHRDAVAAMSDGEEPPPQPDLLPLRRREGEECEDYGDSDIEMLLNHFGTLYSYLGGDEAAVMREWVRLKRLVITL